ncbi:MAG: DUF1003 domain-containing protein [Nanoarchaeota archaeon]
MKKEEIKFKHLEDPAFKVHHNRRTLGQKAADKVTEITGSWGFILFLSLLFFSWVLINGFFLLEHEKGPFNPYPFILLNLVLAGLSVIQAPIILMSNNRQAQKDRIKTEYDYKINKKAEQEIQEIKELLKRKLK